MSKWVKLWYQFLRRQFNATAFRKEDTAKVRKYEHIQIQKEFKKLDDLRREQRKALLLERKKLIQNQINKTQLLQDTAKLEREQAELLNVNSEIQSIQSYIKQNSQALSDVQTKLEDTESEHILVSGIQKIVILNQITYLRYMRTHNAGFTLHAQTQKAIQNIHYLLDHNLPLPKYKLFQVFPQLFQEEIGELDSSIKRLLEERREEFKSKTIPLYRPFELQRKIDPSIIVDVLAQEEMQLILAINKQVNQILSPLGHLSDKISKGETRFRSLKHYVYECRDVEERDQFTEEQWQGKQLVLKALEVKKQFSIWKKASWVKIHDYHFQTRWPMYLNNRPDLVELYQTQWEKYRALVKPLQQLLPKNDPEINYLQLKIRQRLEQQTKRRKAQAINGKMDKSVNSLDAYKMFTECLAEVEEQQLISKQQQKIVKIPKPQKRQLLTKQHEPKISMQQFNKILYLNDRNSNKYNLQFFSKYFGVDTNILKNILDHISVIYRKEGQLKVLKFV